MTVVISEFEVVPEPQPSPPGASAVTEGAPPPLTPRDIEQVVRRYNERARRVEAS